MPRKRMTDADKKSPQKIYTTDREHEQHLRFAAAAGLTYSEYMSRSALQRPMRTRRPMLPPETQPTFEAILSYLRALSAAVEARSDEPLSMRMLEHLAGIEGAILQYLPQIDMTAPASADKETGT